MRVEHYAYELVLLPYVQHLFLLFQDVRCHDIQIDIDDTVNVTSEHITQKISLLPRCLFKMSGRVLQRNVITRKITTFYGASTCSTLIEKHIHNKLSFAYQVKQALKTFIKNKPTIRIVPHS